MTAYEIQLTPIDQISNVSLGGIDYRFRMLWDDAYDGIWILDILDIDSNPIVCGIPLVGGADLLAQYQYLNIGGGGSLYVLTDGQSLIPPTQTNLGGNSHLIWQPYD